MCALNIDLILISLVSLVGGGELYTWGSNENGCLGIGYVVMEHFKSNLVAFIELHNTLHYLRIDVFYFRSTHLITLPEKVEGPFLRSAVDKVSFFFCICLEIRVSLRPNFS